MILIEAKDTSVTSCTIHENTKFIHNHAFSGCTSLESVAIPDGVKGIGGYAFAYCSSLTSATIPDSVTYIGDAFFDCISLKSIIFKGTKEEWNAIEKGGNWEWNTRLCTVYCTDGDIAPAADRM